MDATVAWERTRFQSGFVVSGRTIPRADPFFQLRAKGRSCVDKGHLLLSLVHRYAVARGIDNLRSFSSMFTVLPTCPPKADRAVGLRR